MKAAADDVHKAPVDGSTNERAVIPPCRIEFRVHLQCPDQPFLEQVETVNVLLGREHGRMPNHRRTDKAVKPVNVRPSVRWLCDHA